MLNIFGGLRKKNKEATSADVAKNRLQILIASNRGQSQLPALKVLEEEILQVLKKYVEITEENVDLKLEEDKSTGLEMLELNVTLPDGEELTLRK